MRILFDTQIFSVQPYGGVSRYFYELIRCLQKCPEYTVNIPPIYSENEIARLLQNQDVSQTPTKQVFPFLQKIKRRLWSFLDKRKSISALKKHNYDVFHPTYYDPYFLPYLQRKPFVLTIYDMNHELFPEYFGFQNETSTRKALLAEKASKIIAISENTKKDIMEILGIPSEKIEVIHLATSRENTEEPVSVPDSYLLFVGSRGRYKNFITLAKAFSKIVKSHPTLSLVCTGRAFTAKEMLLLRELEISSKCTVLQTSPQQLAFLYRHAAAFIFPSKYEGFGLPILEAFSYDCPVILSNASCFPEIAGDAALYFETENASTLADVLVTVLNDTHQREALVEKGTERLKKFSWETTTEKTARIYRNSVLENRLK